MRYLGALAIVCAAVFLGTYARAESLRLYGCSYSLKFRLPGGQQIHAIGSEDVRAAGKLDAERITRGLVARKWGRGEAIPGGKGIRCKLID